MIIWRLTKVKTDQDAFNGMGAYKYGGRWNSRNIKMVYCGSTISLCILEHLVHADSDLLPKLYLYRVEIPEQLVSGNSFTDQLNDQSFTTTHGDSWIKAATSVALMVPSVIVPEELNVILNPDHPDYSKITIQNMGIYDLDQRLLE